MKKFICLLLVVISIIAANSAFAARKRLSHDVVVKQLREENIRTYKPMVPKLLEEIDSADEDVRIRAATFLGKSCDASGVGALTRHLTNDPSAEVRYQCAISLIIIRSEKSIPALIEALKDTVGKVALESAVGLSLLGEKEHCLPILSDALNDANRNVRMRALKGLRHVGNTEAISFLALTLDDADPYVRVKAAIFLTELGKNELALSVLEESVKNSIKYVRSAALRGFMNVGNTRAISLIRGALSDPSPEVRKVATGILQNLGQETDVETKASLVLSTTYDVDAAVAYAEQWGGEGRNPAYYDYSDDGGDCANFVSQCLIAGGLDLSAGPGYWAYDGYLPSIPSCTNLNANLVNTQNAQHETRPRDEVEPIWFLPGDPAIFGRSDAHPATHAVFAVTGDATHYATCNSHTPNVNHASIGWFFNTYSDLDRCTYYHISTQLPQEPTVETNSATNITDSSATLNATITDEGGSAIDERRFSWGTAPSCSDGWVTDDLGSANYGDIDVSGDNFSYDLIGLEPDTTYYFQAWAHNSAGWDEGEASPFTTTGPDAPPSVDTFNVSPSSVSLGGSFTISYSVSDDIGLQQTELWRANDVGGAPDWEGTDNPIITTLLSGQTSYSGSFFDAPPLTGTYWYGMHVVDTSWQWSVEPDPPGPIQVTVIPLNQDPDLSNGYVNLSSGDTNTDFYWYVDYYDQDGDFPTLKNVYIDGMSYTMSLYSGSASNGTYLYGPKNLSAGSHNYYFYFSDGYGGSARLPSSGTYSGPSVSSTGDSYEPDDTYSQANWIYDSSPQTHSIIPADDVDWVKFLLSEESEVVIETSGSSGDTRMWLYNSGLTQLEYNDDGGTNTFSRIDCICGVDALPAGIYYVKIDEYGNDDEIHSYDITLTVNGCGGDEDWKSPTGTGGGDNEWTNPENAYTSDNQWATAEGTFLSQDYYNFNFGIPAGATIDGIEAEIEGHGDTGGEEIVGFEIWSESDPGWATQGGWLYWIIGNEGVDAVARRGGPMDKWGETWIASDLYNGTFKAKLTTWSVSDKRYIDNIKIKVYYTVVQGDISGDGKVDFKDFAILGCQWLQSPVEPSADIAPEGGDGLVDFLDLAVLTGHWLEGTTP